MMQWKEFQEVAKTLNVKSFPPNPEKYEYQFGGEHRSGSLLLNDSGKWVESAGDAPSILYARPLMLTVDPIFGALPPGCDTVRIRKDVPYFRDRHAPFYWAGIPRAGSWAKDYGVVFQFDIIAFNSKEIED